MTEKNSILARIDHLPEKMKAEVIDFVEFLEKKNSKKKKQVKRKAGSSPGKYVLTPDFDETPKEFEEYL